MKSIKIFALLCLAAFASASFAATSPLNNPRGLAVDAKGNLYVANTLGGASGTEIYARLIQQAHSLLELGGILVLELGYNSEERVQHMLTPGAGWDRVSITNDLAGIPRVIAAARVAG